MQAVGMVDDHVAGMRGDEIFANWTLTRRLARPRDTAISGSAEMALEIAAFVRPSFVLSRIARRLFGLTCSVHPAGLTTLALETVAPYGAISR